MDYVENIRHWRKRRASIIQMRQDGMSVQKIAKLYDITPQRVYGILKKAAEKGEYVPPVLSQES